MSAKRGQDVLRRILLLRCNNKGMEESRRTRLANSVCANWRRLVEGANNRTRESSWFPTIPFVTKGVTLYQDAHTLANSHARSTHAGYSEEPAHLSLDAIRPLSNVRTCVIKSKIVCFSTITRHFERKFK